MAERMLAVNLSLVLVLLLLTTTAAQSAVTVPTAPIDLDLAANCTFENCNGFCDGECAYRPNISESGTQNLTLYRTTPYNVTDLVDHNTGDAAGDLGFFLDQHVSASKCSPPYTTKKCFLMDHTVVAKFEVQFDATYGPFLKCNPNTLGNKSQYVNMSDWVCAYGDPGPNQWANNSKHDYQQICASPCQRANVSVGKDPSMHHFWFPPHKRTLATYFGGYWYSTPKLGHCNASQHPGDGSGCTWEVLKPPVFINSSCLAERLLAEVETTNATCFKGCGTLPYNTTTPCYVHCVKQSISQGLVVIPTMVQIWEEGFDPVTGCPFLPLSQSGHVMISHHQGLDTFKLQGVSLT